jgi:hypothetical protein
MCGSGQLGMLSAPQGGCSNISLAVDGNSTPPKQLTCLASIAGKSLPIHFTDFYGYAPSTAGKCVDAYIVSSTAPFTSTCECVYSAFCYSSPMTSTNCFTFTLNWCISKPTTSGTVANIVGLWCNGTVKCTCCVSGAPPRECSGSWSSPFNICCGDTLQLITQSQINTGNALGAYSCLVIAGISSIAGHGCFTCGSICQAVVVNTCGALP